MVSDITVVDLTNNLAGPYSTMILADMGANVLKVEVPPHGDDTRTGGPFVNGESTYFASVNRGKKGMTLNLKTDEGKTILEKLIRKGDVLVQSFRPGVMEKLGFPYEKAAEINSRIVYASVSGFGQTGPYSKKGAYDAVIQGYSGIMSITGNEGDDKPVRVGYSVGDLAAGMFTAIAVLGALHVREQVGKGQHVDISMLDCQIALLENALARYMATGNIPKPLGSRHPVLAPFQAYKANDGYFMIAISNDKLFRSFCNVIEMPTLPEDERFKTNGLRAENITELNNILDGIFLKKPKQRWIDILEAAQVPVGPINNIKETVECPQVQAREMIVEVEHPKAGKIKMAGCPLKAALTPCLGKTASPLVGPHTDEILDWLGYSRNEATLFREKGVI
jgi:CoA:oxalate CoA-transferase